MKWTTTRKQGTVFALATLVALAAGAAMASHPVDPINLKQEQACGSPPCTAIPAGSFVTATSVQLTASSDSQTCDSSIPTYKLEFELRPLGTAFTGTPTHSSPLMAKSSCVVQEYPYTVITGLAPGQYHWQVRENVSGYAGTTWVQFAGGALSFTIGNPTQPDIEVSDVNLANMVSGASSLSFTVSPTFKNWGLNAANNFYWRAYLSTDKLKDASDPLIYTSTAAFSVGANTTAIDSGNVTISPKPGPGQYYVLAEADHTNVVAEFNEANNVGSTANYFTSGVDLVATAVLGPTLSGPDSTMVLNVRYFNQGSDAAGSMQLKVYLSLDNKIDGTDFALYTGTKNMTGGQTVNENLTLIVPKTVPGGDFYYILEVDSAKAIAEASELNNVAVSTAKVKMQQADLEAVSVEFVDLATNLPTRVGYFGQSARLIVTMKNIGGADAKAFKVGVVLSADTNLSLLSDTIVHDEPVAVVQSGQTYVLTINFQVPLVDRYSKPFTTGQYYLFAMLDSFSDVGELSEQNNNLAVGGQTPGAISLRTPAQDYTVVLVGAPAAAAVGEAAQVYREIKNAGNVAGSQVSYRFFASANSIITKDDIPLGIVGANGSVSESGSLTLGIGAEDKVTELVKLPPTVPPGTYYFGCIVDPDGSLAELDELNNAAASATTVQVAPSTLQVATSQLPDGVVGRPYTVKLAATGAVGASSWSLDSTQGSLPDGLSLAQDGTLSGTPTTASLNAFTVLVTNGAKSAAARLTLRVLPTTTQLEITTTALPPVINSISTPYQASLGAAGGVKPYTWKIAAGTLPNGINMNTDGLLSGAVKPGVQLGESRVTFEVSDSLGSRARAELKVRVVEPGALFIKSLALPNTVVFSDYLTDLAAQNADGSPLAKPLSWSVASGTLPEGLSLTTDSGERGILAGKAKVAGTYSFALQVEDAKGRADVADFILRVFPNRFRLTAVNPPATVYPGDSVSFSITAGVPSQSMRYLLHSGALPPGVSLEEAGAVSGTVASENSVGVYNFVVEARDTSGGGGLGAFTLEVSQRPREGCSAAGGAIGLVALLPLFGLLRRRR